MTRNPLFKRAKSNVADWFAHRLNKDFRTKLRQGYVDDGKPRVYRQMEELFKLLDARMNVLKDTIDTGMELCENYAEDLMKLYPKIGPYRNVQAIDNEIELLRKGTGLEKLKIGEKESDISFPKQIGIINGLERPCIFAAWGRELGEAMKGAEDDKDIQTYIETTRAKEERELMDKLNEIKSDLTQYFNIYGQVDIALRLTIRLSNNDFVKYDHTYVLTHPFVYFTEEEFKKRGLIYSPRLWKSGDIVNLKITPKKPTVKFTFIEKDGKDEIAHPAKTEINKGIEFFKIEKEDEQDKIVSGYKIVPTIKAKRLVFAVNNNDYEFDAGSPSEPDVIHKITTEKFAIFVHDMPDAARYAAEGDKELTIPINLHKTRGGLGNTVTYNYCGVEHKIALVIPTNESAKDYNDIIFIDEKKKLRVGDAKRNYILSDGTIIKILNPWDKTRDYRFTLANARFIYATTKGTDGKPLPIYEKRGEYQSGVDQFGKPLELTMTGGRSNEGVPEKALLDIWEKGDGHSGVRKVHPLFVNRYPDLLKMIVWIWGEWDVLRDDFRDGRYHPFSRSIADYNIAHMRGIDTTGDFRERAEGYALKHDTLKHMEEKQKEKDLKETYQIKTGDDELTKDWKQRMQSELRRKVKAKKSEHLPDYYVTPYFQWKKAEKNDPSVFQAKVSGAQIRRPADKNPAMDLRIHVRGTVDRTWGHANCKYYHLSGADVMPDDPSEKNALIEPEVSSSNSEWGIHKRFIHTEGTYKGIRGPNPEAYSSTRGLSQYLIELVIRNTLKYEDAIKWMRGRTWDWGYIVFKKYNDRPLDPDGPTGWRER